MGNISREKKTCEKKGVFLLILLAALFLMTQIFTAESVYAETATGKKVTYKGAVSSMGSTCGKFTIKGYDAFCAEHPKTTPATGTKITSTKLVTNSKMRKALYYGYGGPQAKVSKSKAGWVYTSIALSRANGKGGGTSAAQKFYKKLGNYPIPPNSFKVYICNTSGGLQDLCYWIYEPEGKVSIKKTSSETMTTNNKGYSLAGAVYGIYTSNSCTDSTLKGKLTTGPDGTSNKMMLDKGTYYIREMTAPAGFELNGTVYTVSITDQCDKTVNVTDVPKKGKLQLIKSSAIPEITEGNDGYSLSGAQYGVWSDKELKENVGTFITGSDGKSNELPVLAGTYYIQETAAPKGYLKDETLYEVEVSIDELERIKILTVKDMPEEEPVWVIIQKIDALSGEPVASGTGTLEGAEFTVKYYKGTGWTDDPAKAGEKHERMWIFTTNENGCVLFDDNDRFVSGDALYLNNMGKPTIPVGTVTIQETKAPKGYVRNDEIFVIEILENDDEPGVSMSEIPTTEVRQQPISGDLEIVKSDSKTGDRMSGVAFDVIDISSNEVIETLVTNEKGYATTASEESDNGRLPYGEYIIREKEAPLGYLPIDDIKVDITEHKKMIKLEIENVPAEIKTTAYFEENGAKEILPDETVTIIDEVAYKNLIFGTEYRLEGVLMDTETGKPLLIGGEEIRREIVFSPDEPNGTMYMEFIVDASDLSGRSVTVFENLYIDETIVASHTDITDKGQTVRFIAAGDTEIYKEKSPDTGDLKGRLIPLSIALLIISFMGALVSVRKKEI